MEVNAISKCTWPLQIMQLGGNQRARKYFKQHGWDGLGADKIEQKVNLPYIGRMYSELFF